MKRIILASLIGLAATAFGATAFGAAASTPTTDTDKTLSLIHI